MRCGLLEGNPILKTSVEEEVDKLLKKQDAGADFAITQLYYDPKVYDSFVNKARKAGVTIPILAGILPAVTVDRLVRCEKNLGVKVPVELIQKLEQADEADKEKVALDFWENLAKEAVNSGSPGIHMFTFNQSKPSLLLARRLGLTND